MRHSIYSYVNTALLEYPGAFVLFWFNGGLRGHAMTSRDMPAAATTAATATAAVLATCS